MITSLDIFESLVINGDKKHYDENSESYIFTLDKEYVESFELDKLLVSCKEINKESNIRELDGEYEFEFLDSSEAWNKGYLNYFYKDVRSFFRVCTRRREVPSEYYIYDASISRENDPAGVVDKVRSVSEWISLLTLMADHKQKDDGVLVFFVGGDGVKHKKFKINPNMDYSDVDKVKSFDDLNCYEQLLDGWRLNDAHSHDRKSVMLASLAEILSGYSSFDGTISSFLSCAKAFSERYYENYEIYVNRFSIDIQLKEIDQKNIEYISKLQELVSSSQTKALALPGVMVAFGALVKVNSYLAVISVLVGAVVTWIIVKKSNDLISENVSYFEKIVKQDMNEYLRSDIEVDKVKSRARDVRDSVSSQVGRACGRMKDLNTLANVVLVFIILLGFANLSVIAGYDVHYFQGQLSRMNLKPIIFSFESYF